MDEQGTLILSGGNALGAYQGGAYETLHERGFRTDRLFAVSTGAVNAALIAGNPPEARVSALRAFWGDAGQDGAWAYTPAWASTWDNRRQRALQSLLLGSPAFYRPRFPGALSMLPGTPSDTGLYDLAPLRENLERQVDFDLLNDGQIRVVIVAVDANSGEELRFDSAKTPIGVDHILASCGFIPFFPPTRLEGRVVVDGGMSANLPLEAALDEPTPHDRLCIALDLFRRLGTDFKTVGQSMDRQLELLLSTQSWRALKSLRQRHELRRQLRLLASRIPERQRDDPALAAALAEGAEVEGAITLLMLSHAGVPHDTEMRAFDFSRTSLAERWEAGRTDMRHAWEALGDRRAAPGEFAVHTHSGRDSGPQAASD